MPTTQLMLLPCAHVFYARYSILSSFRILIDVTHFLTIIIICIHLSSSIDTSYANHTPRQ